MLMDATKLPELQWDIQLACRLHETGELGPEVGTYTLVDSFAPVIEFVKSLYQQYKEGIGIPISLDLETIGLDEFRQAEDLEDEDGGFPGARIVSVSISYLVGKASVFVVPEDGDCGSVVRDQLEWLCSSPKVKMRGASLKFDARWLWEHWGIRILNQKVDTLLLGSLLNENRGNSLNLHAKIYTKMGGYDDEFNAKYDKARMDLVPVKDLVQYAGGDTDACYRVASVMRKELVKDTRLAFFYTQLLQPASDVFTKMEHRGVVIDPQRYDELEKEVGEELKILSASIFGMMPAKIRMKYADDLKLSRPVILKEYLFGPMGMKLQPMMETEKKKEPSTSMEHMDLLASIYTDNEELQEFITRMREYNSASKTQSTYIKGFKKHIRSDGRFHPTYYLGQSGFGGTVTGRTSAKDPAYQTIPKHTKWAKPLRTVFIPPPGMAILKLDFSQGELRIVACVAFEKTMLTAYKKGMDLHAITGANESTNVYVPTSGPNSPVSCNLQAS